MCQVQDFLEVGRWERVAVIHNLGFYTRPLYANQKGCLFTIAKNTAAGFLRCIPQKYCRGAVILVNLAWY